MATHSSVLAWRPPGTEEPGGLQSMGSHRAGHDGSDLAHKHKCPTHRPRNTGRSRGDERQAAQTADKVRSSDLTEGEGSVKDT